MHLKGRRTTESIHAEFDGAAEAEVELPAVDRGGAAVEALELAEHELLGSFSPPALDNIHVVTLRAAAVLDHISFAQGGLCDVKDEVRARRHEARPLASVVFVWHQLEAPEVRHGTGRGGGGGGGGKSVMVQGAAAAAAAAAVVRVM